MIEPTSSSTASHSTASHSNANANALPTDATSSSASSSRAASSVASGALDVAYARSQFPGLASGEIYFDNAGGSLTLGIVADRVRDYLVGSDVQLGATYRGSTEAAGRYAAARARIAASVGARFPDEIAFGPSSTVLLRLLAETVGKTLREGDEVVVTRVDHESNIGCWTELERFGIVPRFWERNAESGGLELADLDTVLTPRTRFVCCTHVSNILGTIHPIQEIAARVREHGAQLCVDGVAYAPHRRLDLDAWGVDYYVYSSYKVFGPHHAVMYGRRESQAELASTNHFFYTPENIGGKLEPGNANYELSWGAAGVVDYLEELGLRSGAKEACALEAAWRAIAEHESQLTARFLDYVRTRDDLEVVGLDDADPARRVATVSLSPKGRSPEELVRAIDPYGIGIRHGHFHAYRLIEDLGLLASGGVVRVSMSHYNTVDEIDRLIAALEETR